MVRMIRWVAAASALALAGVACGGSDGVAVKLDGSPRRPDVEGVVRKASAKGVTLDGNRTYDVSSKLMTFSTYNHKLVPLASMIGAYVQGGLDGDTIEWLAKVGPVATDATGHRTVQYQGTLVRVDGSVLVFKDGTVLRLDKNLKAPEDALGPVYVVIDAEKHVVQGATFAPARPKP